MKLVWIILIIILVGVLGLMVVLEYFWKIPSKDLAKPIINSQLSENINNMLSLQIKSSVFEDNGKLPSKYTCDGKNINPPLRISGVPANAKSLALILDDPDAPRGTFNHWVVWNIPVTTTEIKEGMAPEGVEGKNSGGKRGYFGPCPPSGAHRYIFKLYALDNTLNIDSNSNSSAIKQAIEGHIIEQAQTTGLYR